MLPPKIGDGVLGSNCGGVKPTGASFTGASAFPSAAAALIVRDGMLDLADLALVKDKVDGCFHDEMRRSPEFGVDSVGVNREAWVAMAMERERERERSC